MFNLDATIKRKDETLLQVLPQHTESHFIVEIIAPSIAAEDAQHPIFNINDSIVITVGNEQVVVDFISGQLTKGVGKAPKLRFEYWKPELIDAHLNELKVKAGVSCAYSSFFILNGSTVSRHSTCLDFKRVLLRRNIIKHKLI